MSSSPLGPPAIPVSNPGTSEETTLTSPRDQVTLHLKRWLPTSYTTSSTPPRALVVFCHGFIEHYGRYENIFPLFAQANIAVTAFDQRGFGRSWTKAPSPKKAHGNTTWPQQFQDIEDVIRSERSHIEEKFGKDKVPPIYLMGHSMGGGLAYGFFSRPSGSKEDPSAEVKSMIKGVICSSPWFKLTKPPASFVVWLAPKVLRYFPEAPFYQTVDVKEISSDEDVQKWTHEDPLTDGHVYLKCLPGPLLGGAKIVDEDYKNWPEDMPLLILHGDADKVTSSKASEEVVEKTKAKDKEYKPFKGLLHECWHEKGEVKVQFINYIIEWITARTSETA